MAVLFSSIILLLLLGVFPVLVVLDFHYTFLAFDASDSPFSRLQGSGRFHVRASTRASPSCNCNQTNWVIATGKGRKVKVVLLGSVATQFGQNAIFFGVGAAIASFVFFFGLAYGASILRGPFRNPRAWRALDIFVGIIMWAIAFGLANGNLMP